MIIPPTLKKLRRGLDFLSVHMSFGQFCHVLALVAIYHLKVFILQGCILRGFILENSEIFVKILFSRILLKHKFATLKIRN